MQNFTRTPLDSKHTPAYTMCLPLAAAPSLNQLLKMPPFQKKAVRTQARALIVNQLLPAYPHLSKPFESIEIAYVEFIRYAPRQLDWDNFLGGMKPIVDCLTQLHPTRNPSGIGLIVADDPSHIPVPPGLFQFKSTEGVVRVNIYELSAVYKSLQ